jgi:hypothetical protein
MTANPPTFYRGGLPAAAAELKRWADFETRESRNPRES